MISRLENYPTQQSWERQKSCRPTKQLRQWLRRLNWRYNWRAVETNKSLICEKWLFTVSGHMETRRYCLSDSTINTFCLAKGPVGPMTFLFSCTVCRKHCLFPFFRSHDHKCWHDKLRSGGFGCSLHLGVFDIPKLTQIGKQAVLARTLGNFQIDVFCLWNVHIRSNFCDRSS